MRVELTVEVFADSGPAADRYRPAELDDLYRLLRCFPEGRHQWVVDFEVLAAAESFLPRHLPELADTYLALARGAVVEQQAWTGTTQGGDPVRVDRADLADHAADLCRQAVLVVENHRSDGAFLQAVAHVLGYRHVLDAIAEEWLEIISGGGSGEVVPLAEKHAGRYRRLVRVVALLDSDRLIPRQRTTSHKSAKRLATLNVAVHVLERREAENYVPNRILAGVGRRADASRRLALLKRLTPEQRGHLDMKHGLRKAEPVQRDLFDGLAREERVGLHDGFGDDLLERMLTARETLTEADFAALGDEVVEELRTMLDLIASRI